MNSANEDSVNREKQLLICCARTRVSPPVAQRIRDLAAQPLDWDYVLYEAEENSLTPLLAKHLAEFAPAALPPASAELLNKTCRANTIRNLYLTGQLIQVLAAFPRKGN